jgi:hypothetical protein
MSSLRSSLLAVAMLVTAASTTAGITTGNNPVSVATSPASSAATAVSTIGRTDSSSGAAASSASAAAEPVADTRPAKQAKRDARRRERQTQRAAEQTAAQVAAQAQQVRADAVAELAKNRPPVQAPFKVATFNALGHSHTVRHGNKSGHFAGSATRTKLAIQIFDDNALDVIGVQEFEKPQVHYFFEHAGGTYGFYGPRHNGVAWRHSKFHFVAAVDFPVPYFHGDRVPMPAVQLRSKETGQEMVFISVHNPADARGPAQKWRDLAVEKERHFVNTLWNSSPRVPVFLLGDMNDRERFFCSITSTHLLHAAAGGSNIHGSCERPTGFSGIDWILGTPGVDFTNFRVIRDKMVARATDHPLVVAQAG